MKVHIAFNRPASFLIHNLGQEICGWITAPRHAQGLCLQFAIDGEPIRAECYRREDVERVHPGQYVIGWTLWLDPAKTFAQPRRTVALTINLGNEWTYTRHFYKSRTLMPEGRDTPLYVMHIPKTAGTALRTYFDFAFSEFPSLFVYGHPPGIPLDLIATSHKRFTQTRDLIFGHFDFGLVRLLSDGHPKVVAIFREPQELVRSYLAFATQPVAQFLDNPLVRHVCGLSYEEPFGLISAKHLDMALRFIERHFYIVQQNNLQGFVDEVSNIFGLERFAVPRINVSASPSAQTQPTIPVDIRFDTQLYEACRQRSQSFLEFLNA